MKYCGSLKAPAVPAKKAELNRPAGETAAPLVWAVAGEYALIGEKESKLLHLFKFQEDRFALVKSYPCIIGANGEDKRKEGDFATPKGSYFTLRYTPGSALPEIYGEGAFVLNYPNFLDRKDSRAGHRDLDPRACPRQDHRCGRPREYERLHRRLQ